MRPIDTLVIVQHHYNPAVNSLEQLGTVLNELRRTCVFDDKNRCLIIDTPSNKDTKEVLTKIDWADVLLTSNQYYQRAGWNIGFRSIKSRYYITCHTDITKMTNGWREELIEIVEESNEKVGGVTAYTYLENEDRYVHTGKRAYLPTSLTLYNRKCLEDVGIFDEEFDPLFTAEDPEWGFRVNSKGWRLLGASDDSGTKIHHLHGYGRIGIWCGNELERRKIEQEERDDVEYLPRLPQPSGLVRENEKKVFVRGCLKRQDFTSEEIIRRAKEEEKYDRD